MGYSYFFSISDISSNFLTADISPAYLAVYGAIPDREFKSRQLYKVWILSVFLIPLWFFLCLMIQIFPCNFHYLKFSCPTDACSPFYQIIVYEWYSGVISNGVSSI